MRDLANAVETHVSRLPQAGMITLRADLADLAVAEALDICGLTVPPQRQIVQSVAGGVGWMSPDEALILCDAAATSDLISRLSAAFDALHALVLEVSDARARFEVAGPNARETLAKLCPVDLAPGSFSLGELRRTRLAQVAAAFWMTGPDTFELVCFRSVADYVEEALTTVSRPDASVGVWSEAQG